MSMVGNYLIVSPAELERLHESPDLIESFLYEEKEEEIIYIDKAWAAIHFTLTGSEWDGDPPLVNVVMGGDPIGDVDVGYGSARGLSPTLVKETFEALKTIDEDKFRSMFNVKLLEENEIYPFRANYEGAIGYVAGYYNDVYSAFRNAAERNFGLIVFLN